jgi:cell shape-determining protein MreD
MDKYEIATKKRVIWASFILGVLYSFVLYFGKILGAGSLLFVSATILGGLISGWLYWRKMYTKQKRFQII